MMKRVWIISRFYAEETGTGYSMTRTAEELAKYFSIHVLCGQPDYLYHERRAPRREFINGVTIIRNRSTNFDNRNMFIKTVNMLTSSLSIFFEALHNISWGEPVLIVNLPPLLPILAIIACRLKRAKAMLLIHDVYPETLVASGVISYDSLATRVIDWTFRLVYQMAGTIIVLGRDMHALLANKIICDPSKIRIIPNTADVDRIYPVPRNQIEWLRKLRLDGKFIIKYSGHMGRTHDLGLLLDAARRIDKLDPAIHFIFMGDGPKKLWLVGEISRNIIANVSIMSYLPKDEILESINGCDVGLISLMPGMAGVSVPGRIYELWAAGKPVIVVADENSELALMTNEDKLGWVVPPRNTNALVQAIQEAKSNRPLLSEMGFRARRIAEQKYARGKQIDAYCALISSLLCAK